MSDKSKSHDIFDERFDEYQVKELEMMGKTPAQANSYDKKFNGDEVLWLLKVHCPNEIAVRYDERFSGKTVFKFYQAEIPPEVANQYDSRFSTSEIIEQYKIGFFPDEANQSRSQRFSQANIIELAEKGCPLEQAEQYALRFAAWEIGYMHKAGCTPQEAEAYGDQCNGRTIAEYVQYHISPEDAKRFNKKGIIFDAEEILTFKRLGCLPQKTNKYEGFASRDIVRLIEVGCSPEKANRLKKNFAIEEIIALHQLDCPLDTAIRYDLTRFDGPQVVRLFKANCLPEQAEQYDHRFNGEDVVHFVEARLTPETVNQYDPALNAANIVIINQMGYHPGKIAKTAEKKLQLIYKVSKSVVKDVVKPGQSIEWNFRLIELGGTAIILQKDGKAFKYAAPDELRHESFIYSLLEKIDYQHIVKLLGERKDENTSLHFLVSILVRDGLLDKLALELEFIDGMTLEQIIKKEGQLDHDRVFRYGAGILKGIEELHSGFLYHRDLHDRNIMIRKETDEPVIIDLGTVVTRDEQNHVHDLNRVFGGNNDMVSLGQLMYKMATGQPLFWDKEWNNQLADQSEVKNRIKKIREDAYFDEDLKVAYFQKVRDTVGGNLADIIIQLLDKDLWKQPNISEMYSTLALFNLSPCCPPRL